MGFSRTQWWRQRARIFGTRETTASRATKQHLFLRGSSPGALRLLAFGCFGPSDGPGGRYLVAAAVGGQRKIFVLIELRRRPSNRGRPLTGEK